MRAGGGAPASSRRLLLTSLQFYPGETFVHLAIQREHAASILGTISRGQDWYSVFFVFKISLLSQINNKYDLISSTTQHLHFMQDYEYIPFQNLLVQ